jgi:hypothetical protein
MQTMEVVPMPPAHSICLLRPSPTRYSENLGPDKILEFLGDAGAQFGIPFSTDGPDWEQSMLSCFEILWHEDNHLFFKLRSSIHAEYSKLNFHTKRLCLPEPISIDGTFFCDPTAVLMEADPDRVAVVRTHRDETGKRLDVVEYSCFVSVPLFQSWIAKGNPARFFREYEKNGYKSSNEDLL